MNEWIKNAFDEIHAEEALKEKTRRAVFEKRKKRMSARRPYVKYAAASAACGFVFS